MRQDIIIEVGSVFTFLFFNWDYSMHGLIRLKALNMKIKLVKVTTEKGSKIIVIYRGNIKNLYILYFNTILEDRIFFKGHITN